MLNALCVERPLCVEAQIVPTKFCSAACWKSAFKSHKRWHKEQSRIRAENEEHKLHSEAENAAHFQDVRENGSTFQKMLAEAEACSVRNDLKSAIKVLKKAVKTATDTDPIEVAYFNLANTMCLCGDSRSAAPVYDTAAQLCRDRYPDRSNPLPTRTRWAEATVKAWNCYLNSEPSDRPEWWTDASLKDLSRDVVIAASSSFEAWQMRAFVLQGTGLNDKTCLLPTGDLQPAEPRSPKEMMEAATAWRRVAALYPRGAHSAKNVRECMQKAHACTCLATMVVVFVVLCHDVHVGNRTIEDCD